MHKTRKLVAAAAIATIAAAGGSAITNSNTLEGGADVTLGFGEQTISGVNATSVVYNFNATKDAVTGVTLVLMGDTTSLTVQTAFNGVAPATCSGAGSYDAGADETTYTCLMSEDVTAVTSFQLFASNDV